MIPIIADNTITAIGLALWSRIPISETLPNTNNTNALISTALNGIDDFKLILIAEKTIVIALDKRFATIQVLIINVTFL